MTHVNAFPFIVRLNRVDCLTLSSVFTTALAAAFTLEGHHHLAMALLFVAMGCDGLDGMLARKWGLARNFGRYLDGFMDVLIYLVSPALVAYQSGFGGAWGLLLMLTIGCGCVRLAVFNEIGNIEDAGRYRYLGMPVFWSLFIIAAYQLLLPLLPPLLCNLLLAVALLVFSVLMVSRQPFFKFTALWQILLITFTGALLFLLLDLRQRGLILHDLDAQSLRRSGLHPARWPWELVYWLQLPVVVGGVLHMLVVTKNWLPALTMPIHRRWFGANKTVRGFVMMPLLSALGGACVSFNAEGLWLGALAGFAYVLAELPNSFLKRRLGVAPGQLPQHCRRLFLLLDQLDSAVGVALLYWLLGYGWQVALLFLLSFPLTALVVKQILFRLRLKKTAC